MNRKNIAALQTLDRFIKSVRDCIEVPNEYLPEAYRTKRGKRTLSEVENKFQQEQQNLDPRAIRGSKERQAVIDNYACQVALGLDIEYNENEDKLYRNQQAFAQAMNLDME